MAIGAKESKVSIGDSEKGYEGKSMAEFFKNNGFNLANGLTIVILIGSFALLFGTTTADVRHLKASMLQTESKEVAETRDESIIREINVLREGVREEHKALREDINRLESKIDEISDKLLQLK